MYIFKRFNSKKKLIFSLIVYKVHIKNLGFCMKNSLQEESPLQLVKQYPTIK